MREFLFCDLATGEEFFVEAETKIEAKKIAKKYFDKPKYIDEFTYDEADMLGYDTY